MRARRSAAPAANGPGKLVVMAGPAAGEEFTLTADESVIGRSSDNAIAIPDTTVSRKHVLVRKTADGWAASDMGSGNGTQINGKAIAEETPLKHGDLIAIGDSELRFEDPAAVGSARRPPVRRGELPTGPINTGTRTRAVVRSGRRGAAELADDRVKKKKLFVRVGAALVLVLAGAVTFRAVRAKEERSSALASMSAAERKKALSMMKQEGTNLVRDGKWKEAKAKFLELQAEDTGNVIAGVTDLLAAADREIPNQERLTECADALAKGEIAAAARALEQVSQDTTQYKQRDKLKEAIDKRVAERLNDGRALLASTSDLPKMKELKALVEDVLVARPENRDALAYKETADQAIHRIEHPPPPPRPPGPKPWLDVQSRFASGDQTGAYALAESCASKFSQCKTLRGQMKEFSDKFKNAENAKAAELLALVELDQKISGGKSGQLTRNLAKKAADALYLKCTSAKSSGNWQSATEYCGKALKVDPGHPGASALLAEARNQAKDVFLRAYQLEPTAPDEAIKLYRDVLAMTPRDNEYHQKSKNRIEKLASQ